VLTEVIMTLNEKNELLFVVNGQNYGVAATHVGVEFDVYAGITVAYATTILVSICN